ncbi:MAG: toprim domain-containing protein [Thermodesulfovibrionales bacterium]|nr:toprim domain-containing protein [Thermodesulfovibrionales bacterium]
MKEKLNEESRERFQALEELFRILSELNRRIPVIVEGKNDMMALRALGLEGEIIQVYGGKSLYELSEEIHERFESIILLIDWDRKGESLMKTLGEYLSGLWEDYRNFRETLKILARNEAFEIEQIPALMERLKRQCEIEA